MIKEGAIKEVRNSQYYKEHLILLVLTINQLYTMGLFDFFKKKPEAPNEQSKNTNHSEQTDINNSIEIQKEGYLELAKACLAEPRRTSFAKFIENLEDYNGDDDFIITLNFVIHELYKNQNAFIISLDWKQEISSLAHGISFNLKENFNHEIELPDPEKYGPRASVSYDNVFKDYNQAISLDGFQLSFLDTDSDSYNLVVHKIKDLDAIRSAFRKIGYHCLDVNSYKISG